MERIKHTQVKKYCASIIYYNSEVEKVVLFCFWHIFYSLPHNIIPYYITPRLAVYFTPCTALLLTDVCVAPYHARTHTHTPIYTHTHIVFGRLLIILEHAPPTTTTTRPPRPFCNDYILVHTFSPQSYNSRHAPPDVPPTTVCSGILLLPLPSSRDEGPFLAEK